MGKGVESFDNVVCISLVRRPDRVREFKNSIPADWPFATVGAIDAVDGTKCLPPDGWKGTAGAWGCYRSHLQIMEIMLSSNDNSVLIFEDDAVFCPDFTKKALAFLDTVPDDWGMIYLGGEHGKVPYDIKRTHAFAMHRRALEIIYRDPLIHDWTIGCNEDGRFEIDDRLGTIAAKQLFKTFYPTPWLVGQAKGLSDISCRLESERFWK